MEQNRFPGTIKSNEQTEKLPLGSLKNIREKLLESEERFRMIIENVSDAIIIHHQRRFVYLNRQALILFGADSDQALLGTDVLDRIEPAYHAQVLARIRRHAEERKPVLEPLSQKYLRLDGSAVWVETIGQPIFYKSKDCSLVFARDISARLDAEKQYETLFREMLNAFALHEIVCNEHGQPIDYRFLTVNPAFERMTGLKADQVKGKRVLEILPATEKHWIDVYGQVALQGKPAYFEGYSAALKKYFEVNAFQPVHGQFVCIFAEITERKLHEQALEKEQQEKEIILSNLAERVAFLDLDMRVVWANHTLQRGYLRRDRIIIGKKCHAIFYHLDQPCPNCPIVDVFKTGRKTKGIHKTPDHRYFEVTGTPIYNEQEELIGVLDTALEVTELKEAEAELVKLNQELEKRVELRTAELQDLNEELDAFTYSVSHDLRAPLRRINGFSQALIEEAGPKLDLQNRDYLQRIIVSSGQMSDLINDLLKLSRISRKEITREIIELSVLISIYLKTLQNREPQREVNFVIEPGMVIVGDTALIRIALENLLDNAWKFTSLQDVALIEFGQIIEGGRNILFIRDNGAGFEQHLAHKLFAPFQRLHGVKEYSGTGIGLSIVSRVIRKHGGEIWAEGAAGQGATFYFTLPM